MRRASGLVPSRATLPISRRVIALAAILVLLAVMLAPTIRRYDDDEAEAQGVARGIADLVAKGTSLAEIAVLYRTNSQSEAIETALADAANSADALTAGLNNTAAAADGAGRLGPARHVEAGAPARLQVAHRNQLVVGLDHGEARHAVVLGKLADRRQARAGAQDAVVDAGAHGGDDLVHQRGGAVGGEGELQHGRLRCIGRIAGPVGRLRPVREGDLSG
mgnify:CR=1 FL=1